MIPWTDHHHSNVHTGTRSKTGTGIICLLAAASFNTDMRDNGDDAPLLNVIYTGCTDLTRRLHEWGADIGAARTASRDDGFQLIAGLDR